MRPSRAKTHKAAGEVTTLDAARTAIDIDSPGNAHAGGISDPLLAELRRAGLLPMLVLHFVRQGPSYGNQLIERIADLTGGMVAINPNTMYPLLRRLESQGLVIGEWEHPERRSRRFYRITSAGEEECLALRGHLQPRFDQLAMSVEAIRSAVFSEQ